MGPVRGSAKADAPVSVSQACTTPWVAVTKRRPSRVNATWVTVPLCRSSSLRGSPVTASQSRAVRSSLPVATNRPSSLQQAETTAASLAEVLGQRGLLRHDQATGTVTLLATDGPERFARVGAVFLGRPLLAADVEIVDLAFAQAPSSA